MSESKHTPGPLVVNSNELWDVVLNVDDANGATVCRLDNKGNWFPADKDGTTQGRSQNRMIADAARLALCWNTHDALVFHLLAASNYIDTLGGDSQKYRAALALVEGA